MRDVGYRYNPAPGWPAAQEGWLPPPDWKPDPSWPPAPRGWAMIIDEDGNHISGSPLIPPPVEFHLPRSTRALTVVAIAACVSLLLLIPGLPTLILAVAARMNARSRPELAKRLTKIGWIVFAGLVGFTAIATIIDYVHNP